MLVTLWHFVYPFTAFLFIRGALRSFAAWAANPRAGLLFTGILLSALTFHAGWQLFGWAAILPHWWLTPLIVVAFFWVGFKNTRQLWKFESLPKETPHSKEESHGPEADL